MNGINKAILIGNLGRDPEIRLIDNDRKVAKFSIATTESWKDKTTGERVDKTEWHNIVLWRGLADIAENYLKKGDKVFIEGKIRTRSYEKDGVTKYFTEIVGDNLIMLNPKNIGSPDTVIEGTTKSGTTVDSTDEKSNPDTVEVGDPITNNINDSSKIDTLPF